MNAVQMDGHVKTEPKCELMTNGKWKSTFIIGCRNARYKKESTFWIMCYNDIANYVREKIHEGDYVLIFGYLSSCYKGGKHQIDIILTRFNHIIDKDLIIGTSDDPLLENAILEITTREETEILKEF
jgi:hypothetical protein